MFDVRALVLFVVVLDVLVLSSVPRPVDLIAAALLAVVLVVSRAWTQLTWLFGLAAALVAGQVAFKAVDGPVAGALGLGLGYLWRYALAGCLGWFLVTSVSPGQFMAAMTRLRVPRVLLVPIAVVMRFVPTVIAEARAIRDSMRMRSVVPHRRDWFLHPLRTAEHLIIPLLAVSVRAGDELTAAALTRGFGAQARRTTITRLRFRAQDAALVLATTVTTGYALGLGGS